MKIPLPPVRFLRFAREQFPEKVGAQCFRNQEFIQRSFIEVKYGHGYGSAHDQDLRR